MHQFRPVNPEVGSCDAFALHASGPINYVGDADEHLLRITTTQSARAAKRTRIHNRHVPSGLSTPVSNRRTGYPGSDHNEIELPFHATGLYIKLTKIPAKTANSKIENATAPATFQFVDRAIVKSEGRLMAGPAIITAIAAPAGAPAESNKSASGISKKVGIASGSAISATIIVAIN